MNCNMIAIEEDRVGYYLAWRIEDGEIGGEIDGYAQCCQFDLSEEAIVALNDVEEAEVVVANRVFRRHRREGGYEWYDSGGMCPRMLSKHMAKTIKREILAALDALHSARKQR